MTIIELRDEVRRIVGPSWTVCVDVEAWHHRGTGHQSVVYGTLLSLGWGSRGQRFVSSTPEGLLEILRGVSTDRTEHSDIEITSPKEVTQ